MSYKDLREAVNINHSKHVEQILGKRSSRVTSFFPQRDWMQTECTTCQTTLYKPKWAFRENNYCDQDCAHKAQKKYPTLQEKYRAERKRRIERMTPEQREHEREMQRKRYEKWYNKRNVFTY